MKKNIKLNLSYPILFAVFLVLCFSVKALGQSYKPPSPSVSPTFNNVMLGGSNSGKLTFGKNGISFNNLNNLLLSLEGNNENSDLKLNTAYQTTKDNVDLNVAQNLAIGMGNLGLNSNGGITSAYPISTTGTLVANSFTATNTTVPSSFGPFSANSLTLNSDLTAAQGNSWLKAPLTIGDAQLSSNWDQLLVSGDININGAVTAKSVGSYYYSGWSSKGITENASCIVPGTVLTSCNLGMDANSILDSLVADSTANSCTGTVTSGKITVAAYCFDPTGQATGGYGPPPIVGDLSAPPSLAYQVGLNSVLVNNPITVNPIQFDAGKKIDGTAATVQSCTISPALPNGMNVDNSCVISGTPTTDNSTVPNSMYAVTLTNSDGSQALANVFVKILAKDLSTYPKLSYPKTATFVGMPITITPDNLDPGTLWDGTPASISSCDIDTNTTLPAGLTIDNKTCVISGTPTVANGFSFTGYGVHVTNSGQNVVYATAYMEIQPDLSAPPSLAYAAGATTGYIGSNYNSGLVSPTTANPGKDPSGTGYGVVSCNVTPALPTGLTMDNTCTVKGIPLATTNGIVQFTATLTNSNSQTAQGQFNLLVKNNASTSPSLDYNQITGVVGIPLNSNMGSPAHINPGTNADGVPYTITNCTIYYNLPAGLILDPNTCIISGTPSVVSANNLYTVTLTNSNNNVVVAYPNVQVVSKPALTQFTAVPNPTTATGANYYFSNNMAGNLNFSGCTGNSLVDGSLITNGTLLSDAINGYGFRVTSNGQPLVDGTYGLGTTSPCTLTLTAYGVTSAPLDVNKFTINPPAPVISAKAGDTKVTVSWANINDPSVSSIAIYRTDLSPSQLLTTVPYSSGSYADTTVVNGKPYTYYAKAVANGVNSTNSNLVAATPALPTPPVISMSATDKLTVSWAAINNPDISYVLLYRSDNPGLIYKTLAASTTSYVDSVQFGTPFSYFVKVRDTLLHDSVQSNTVTGTAYGALAYSPSAVTAYIGTPFSFGAPTPLATYASNCTSSPVFPASIGFAFSGNTVDYCSLSGTPSVVSGPKNYTINAVNASNKVMATGQLTLQSLHPLSYGASSYFFTQNQAITTIKPTYLTEYQNNLTQTSCVATLPAGLSADSLCQITGTPTQVSGGTYKITLNGSNGYSSSVNLFLGVPFSSAISVVPYKQSVLQVLAAANNYQNYYSSWNRSTPTRLKATLTFGSAVTNFPTTAANLNTALGLNTAQIKTLDPVTSLNGGTTYTFWIQPVATSGPLTFTVPAGTFSDSSGNKNSALSQAINYGACAPQDEQDAFCGTPSTTFYKARICTGTWAWGSYPATCTTHVVPAGTSFVP